MCMDMVIDIIENGINDSDMLIWFWYEFNNMWVLVEDMLIFVWFNNELFVFNIEIFDFVELI